MPILYRNRGLSADCDFSANVTVFVLQPMQSTDIVIFDVPPNKLVKITIPNDLPVNTVLFPEMVAYHIASQQRIVNFTFSAARPESIGYISVNNRTGL